VDACVTDVRQELSRVREVIDVRRAKLAIGLAGTVTALSAMQLGLDRYDASRTHHSILQRAVVDTLFARLSATNVEERRKLLAEPERADVIIGGAAVLLTILHELDIGELLVSEHDILDGLAESLRTG
jgi:exopolyphosphatase/guanosine-5'-triphosphate,3'-diphosphate pyrophosphatase